MSHLTNNESMENHGQTGVFGLIVTVLMFGLAIMSLQAWAAIFTMFSGACVGSLALYRLYKEIKAAKNVRDENRTKPS